MKSWRKPEAVGQEFAANEYVSACVKVSCDFDDAKIPAWGYGLAIPEGVTFPGSDTAVYFPCDHEFDVNVDELLPCQFTHTTSGPANEPLGASYPAYYWLDVKEDGSADFHATSATPDQLDAGNAS